MSAEALFFFWRIRRLIQETNLARSKSPRAVQSYHCHIPCQSMTFFGTKILRLTRLKVVKTRSNHFVCGLLAIMMEKAPLFPSFDFLTHEL